MAYRSDPYRTDLVTAREHIQILHDSRQCARVGGSRMGQCLMPDNQAAGARGDRSRAQFSDRDAAWIDAGGYPRQPCFELPVKARHTTERALIGSGVGEIQDRLRAEVERRSQRDVPMQRRALKTVSRTKRRIDAANVDVHPQIPAAPDLRERGVN